MIELVRSPAKGRSIEETAPDLVRLALETPANRLGARIAAWSQGHEGPETIDARQHEERGVSWRTDADGMIVITARVAPANGGAACAVIDTHVTRNRAPAGASLRQQRADAFIELLTGGGGDVTAEIVVHVRGDEPVTLADGTPLTDHVVTSL
jgi:hypothetical protein